MAVMIAGVVVATIVLVRGGTGDEVERRLRVRDAMRAGGEAERRRQSEQQHERETDEPPRRSRMPGTLSLRPDWVRNATCYPSPFFVLPHDSESSARAQRAASTEGG